jgi:hypothetical protein
MIADPQQGNTYTVIEGTWIKKDKGLTEAEQNKGTKPEDPKEGDFYTAVEQVWVADPNTEAALYQIPVMKVENLELFGIRKVLEKQLFLIILQKY